MKNLIRVTLLLLLFISLGALSACAGEEVPTVRVMLSCSDGITVLSANPIDVPVGSDAEFEVSFDKNYAVENLSEGELKKNTVTVPNVTKRTIVNLTAVNVGYDTTVQYRYYFEGADGDGTTLPNASRAYAGTLVTVTANEKFKAFAGWSFGGYTTNKDKIVSTDRSFTFRLSPELAKNNVVKLYANYVDTNSFFYNPNGGVVNEGTVNRQTNDYYSTKSENGKLKVILSQKYLSSFECVSLFYDDATFTREGYVLTEYNTKPDGTGEAYSLGSKFFVDNENDLNEVYCIWKPVTQGFSYVEATMPRPTTEARAPMWKESGVMITGLEPDGEEIVIPEMIDGKYVIGIKSGALAYKSMKTLVLSKYIQRIEDGAIKGCSLLETVYYPDSIYHISNDAFDEASYTAFKNLYVNATTAPRYSSTGEGAFSLKLSRLLASRKQNRIIVIAGSSTYQGLSTEYMEALLEGEYRLINFGTTRTTNGLIYLEAMKKLAHEGDIVLFAPENSTYMMGECELYWKTLRDLESMNNFFRYIDISNYTNVFSAFASFNQNYKYTRNTVRYEQSVDYIEKGNANKYGDYLLRKENTPYVDTYFLPMNDKFKNKDDGAWNDVDFQNEHKDYNNDYTWSSVLDDKFKSNINLAAESAKSSGAKVYFTFCPIDADKLVSEAKNTSWLAAYDKMIKDNFAFDGILGESKNYVYAHEYFYDCAFHLNDTGRTFRTYRMYTDLCTLLGKKPKEFTSLGTSFSGCTFEEGNTSGVPAAAVEYLK